MLHGNVSQTKCLPDPSYPALPRLISPTFTMKIIDKEEREAHKLHIISEGMKGMLYGGIVSLGLYTYLKKCRTALFARLNTSIKTCIIVMPTISLSAFWADAGSVQFDRKMYSSGYANKKLLEEYAQWKNLSFYEKAVQAVSTRK